MIAGTLIRNETIKTTRRLSFWLTTLFFAGILTIVLAERHSADGPVAGFPDVWVDLVGSVGPLGGFFGAILVVLLVTSEFSYRTARQNVIDGLSKKAWFAGKLLLVPALAALFVLIALGFGLASGLLGEPGAGGIARGVDLVILGAYALATVMLLSGAFMLSIATRSGGAAMAAFFLYIALIEGMFGQLLGHFIAAARPVLQYLPFNSFIRLIEAERFDPSIVARAAAAAAEKGEPFTAPAVVPPAILFGMGAAWTILFVAVAWVIYSRRDL